MTDKELFLFNLYTEVARARESTIKEKRECVERARGIYTLKATFSKHYTEIDRTIPDGLDSWLYHIETIINATIDLPWYNKLYFYFRPSKNKEHKEFLKRVYEAEELSGYSIHNYLKKQLNRRKKEIEEIR